MRKFDQIVANDDARPRVNIWVYARVNCVNSWQCRNRDDAIESLRAYFREGLDEGNFRQHAILEFINEDNISVSKEKIEFPLPDTGASHER